MSRQNEILMRLTKREFFAAMAMQGIVAKDGARDADTRKCNAIEAVCMADKLIEILDRDKFNGVDDEIEMKIE